MNWFNFVIKIACTVEQPKSFEEYKSSINDYRKKVPFMVISHEDNDQLITHKLRFNLFWDTTPKTCMNFAKLLEGNVKQGETDIGYKNSIFHRIINNFMMQGGTFKNIYGNQGCAVFKNEPRFKDENFIIKHTKPGLLSMANAGKNTNGSQFFITFKKTPHLDGLHTVFGEVYKKDLDYIYSFAKVKTNEHDRPINDVRICECGFEDPEDEHNVL